MNKTIKNTFLAAIATAVLCAGTVSARQLQTPANLLPVCRGACSTTVHCNGACLCQIFTGTTGGCVGTQGRSDHRKNSLEADASASAALLLERRANHG